MTNMEKSCSKTQQGRVYILLLYYLYNIGRYTILTISGDYYEKKLTIVNQLFKPYFILKPITKYITDI